MNTRRSVWAVVPAKSFSHGKSRLSGVLEADDRARFARSLFDHVLGVLAACDEIEGTLVVTSAPEVAEAARAKNARVLPDSAPNSLSAIIDAALQHLRAEGAGAALVLMADLPLLRIDDARLLAAALQEHDVVVAPDHSEQFTNALGMAPPAAIRSEFGSRGSFDRHCAAARAAGLSLIVQRNERLAHDVDGPEDLARLRAAL